MTDKNEAVGNGTLYLRACPITPDDGFLISSLNFYRGVLGLSFGQRGVEIAASFLAAHSVECALKAFLSYRGAGRSTLSKKPYGHDLLALWKESSNQGLGIEVLPPRWLETLNQGHSIPYFRYHEGVHSVSAVNCEALPGLVGSMLDIVFESTDQTFRPSQLIAP